MPIDKTKSTQSMPALTEGQWQEFQDKGYLRLGRILNGDELRAQQQRIDDIMLGKANVDYERLIMQLDRGASSYANVGEQTTGFKGATLDYRKIQGLDLDPLFLSYLQRPLFKNICERTYGENPVLCLRAMFMNKPAHRGSVLPWHQDRWTTFDRDPQITVWTALDPATTENGCVHIIEGSHRKLINPDHPSGFLTEKQIEEVEKDAVVVPLILEAGEAILLHNWLLHTSDVNQSDIPRRAFSVCYMDGETRIAENGQPVDGLQAVFGKGSIGPNYQNTT